MNQKLLKVDIAPHNLRDRFVIYALNWDGAIISELVAKTIVMNGKIPVKMISKVGNHARIELPSGRIIKVNIEELE